MATKTFDLTKYKGLSIRSFALRELDGADEIAAAERATVDGKLDHARLREQLVADAIVEVNGETVTRPYFDWSKWNAKTRDFVRAAFTRLNDAEPGQLDDFLKTAFGE